MLLVCVVFAGACATQKKVHVAERMLDLLEK
jgi:hypothetical protein